MSEKISFLLKNIKKNFFYFFSPSPSSLTSTRVRHHIKLEIIDNMSENPPSAHSPKSAVRTGRLLKELDPDNACDNAFKMVSIFYVVVIFVRLFFCRERSHPIISHVYSIGNRI